MLWLRGRCGGVVDWVDACRGPWACHIAHCRWNLIRLGSAEVADQFLAAYQAATGQTYHPYWEVASALEHSPSSWTPEHVGEAEPRLTAALGLLGQLPKRR